MYVNILYMCMHTHAHTAHSHLGGQKLGQLMLPNYRKIKDV